jgi:hypothetical protein
MNLFFHPEGDDWSLRSYVSFGPMASVDQAMATIEARAPPKSHKGIYFLLQQGYKPFWQRDTSSLNCTVCVDNEYHAKPADYVPSNRDRWQPCEPYRACVIPRDSVNEKLVYAVGTSLDILGNQTHVVWREKSHDW